MATSGKQIRAFSFIVAFSAVLGLVAAAVGSLLVAALALGGCLLGAAVLLTRKEPEPEPPVVIEKVVVTTPGLAAYDLLELIGSGTMGELWKAKHKALGRVVALKRIKSAVADAEDSARFKREARATSDLRSPHTVEVFDFGEDNGVLFYAMECLDGIDLQRLITRDGPIPPARAIPILAQACHSLADAHAQGVVHRDIKPANLMLCRYGLDLDFVKLLDFGLAKAVHKEGTEGALTRQGIVLGTAAYVAPESLKGSALVDARADIYALGAIAFWLVTGRLVFDLDKSMAMVRAHLSQMPPLASTCSRFAIPRELDETIAWCLKKDPDQRPQTASELSERLLSIHSLDRWTKQDAAAWWEASSRRASTENSPAA
ncbi:MAG: serine/threonine-protein kinase [Myxococcales bacterium]